VPASRQVPVANLDIGLLKWKLLTPCSRSERAAGWVSGSQPQSSHHSSAEMVKIDAT